ncbi:hypothetical protein AAC387_Pa11g0458 [Persea americana]
MADNSPWENFKSQFKKKFIPDHVIREKKVEFHFLKQELMTVGDYIHGFTRLSRFAPEFIYTARKKADIFIKGLRPSIHKDVSMYQRHATYVDDVDGAYWSEEQH